MTATCAGGLLVCHRCRSTNLILREVRHEIAEWSDGLFIRDDGQIVAAGTGYSYAGDVQPQLTEIECGGCGHIWHPKRQFAGGVE